MLFCCFCFIFLLGDTCIDGFQWLGLKSHKTFLTVQKKAKQKKEAWEAVIGLECFHVCLTNDQI